MIRAPVELAPGYYMAEAVGEDRKITVFGKSEAEARQKAMTASWNLKVSERVQPLDLSLTQIVNEEPSSPQGGKNS